MITDRVELIGGPEDGTLIEWPKITASSVRVVDSPLHPVYWKTVSGKAIFDGLVEAHKVSGIPWGAGDEPV